MKRKLYERLLVGTRFRKSKVSNRTLEEEAESDRGRVLFSAPFRRLQSKAQVFSLENNASIRSRLTHSLEVSTIGRQVAQAALKVLQQKEKIAEWGLEGRERAFIVFVETACLIHDMGNPPFGHFGESAISAWFYDNRSKLDLPNIVGDSQISWTKHLCDFQTFDGNPQGFRIITRLQMQETGDLSGLNLTATTLAATMKYPGEALRHKGKICCFLTEQEIVEWVHRALHTRPNKRHPLVTLMEAADDIAYCLSDIEDSIEKGIVTEEEFADHLAHAVKPLRKSNKYESIVSRMDRYVSDIRHHKSEAFRVGVRLNHLMDLRSHIARFIAPHVGKQYFAKHADILEGDLTPLLNENDDSLLGIFKSFAKRKIYFSRTVLQREISANSILTGILDQYLPVLACDRERFEAALAGKSKDSRGRRITVERSLIKQFARRQLALYHSSVARLDPKRRDSEAIVMERVYRIRLVIDFLSGMTDDYALRTYHLLSGGAI